MRTRRLALVFVGTAALFLLASCYVEVDGKKYGQEDTALPGASIEKGCVLKIEPGGRVYPPDYVVLFRKPEESTPSFTRYAGASSGLEVGKCYQWKLGIRDPSLKDVVTDPVAGMKEIASDTVREIDP